MNNPKIARCVEALHRGEVIIYPTEAVWGLGCDPFNRHAVEQLLSIKKRDPDKGLILVSGDIRQFDFIIHDLAADKRQILDATWPGHNTWLVPHHGRVPANVSGRFDTIALRVSTHPVIEALSKQFGGPIVSTSANWQGFPPATSGFKARCYFKSLNLSYAPGHIGLEARPSTIRDLATGETLRS